MARSYQDLLASAREQVPEVQVPDLASRRSSGDSPLVIDVREQHEWDEGHIPGAIHIPRSFLESRIAGVATPDQEVILSCASGNRSLLAGTTLREMGYSNVESLAGGFQRWKQSGQDYTVPQTLTPDQRSRYSRHVLIPEIGEEGQLELLGSKALLIGAGGLGSPAALYLAAAGVGTLGLVDDDVVDASNLQRQIIHTTDRVGMNKGESARVAIEALNPDVTVNVHPVPGRQGQRARPDRRLRRDHRRDRQLPDALPDERRGADGPQAPHPRQHPALRGARLDVHPVRGPLLPVPLPGAPAARTWRPRVARPACSECSAA